MEAAQKGIANSGSVRGGSSAHPLRALHERPDARDRQEGTRRRDAIFRRSLVAADILALALTLGVVALLVGGGDLAPFAFVLPLILIAVAKVSGLYDRDTHLLHKTTLEEVPTLFAIAVGMTMLLLLGDDPLSGEGIGRSQLLLAFVLLFLLMVTLRAASRFLCRQLTAPERCLVVGNTSRLGALLDALKLSPAAHAEIVGVVPTGRLEGSDGSHAVPDSMLDELLVDRVVIAPGSNGTDELMFAIRGLRDAGIKVSILPDLSRLAGSTFERDSIGGMTLMGMRRFAITRSSRIVKRTFDLCASAFFLVLFAPLLALIAVAIRLDSPGPVLFRQERVGRHGKRFSMLKLRSMHADAEAMRAEISHLNEGAEGLFKIADDPRITRVGRMIRRTSLDELPQLLNVLRGDMSLVGPRPLVPEEDDRIVGLYRDRLDVPPGMTGHWQVLGAARVPLEEMVKLDYLYIANWSLWNDIVLLCRTMPVVARRRGM